MFNGNRVSVWDNDKVQEMAGGDGCPIRRMYLMPPDCGLQNA